MISQSSCVVRSHSVGGWERQNPCSYLTVGFKLVMSARTESIWSQLTHSSPLYISFWPINPTKKQVKSDKTDSCLFQCAISSLACGLWASGDDVILSHRYDSAVTKHWLYYLGSGHFDLPETTGSCQAGCDAEVCFHNLVCIIFPKLKLVAWIFHHLMMSNRKYTLVCKYKVCLGACVGPCFIPGVWKLMRLISTGSVGWWAIISALLKRLLVPGSESLRLLWVKRAISTCKQAGREKQTL